MVRFEASGLSLKNHLLNKVFYIPDSNLSKNLCSRIFVSPSEDPHVSSATLNARHEKFQLCQC